jgi:ribosomal protein S18 acetylase RimI-like enzyme
MSLSIRTLLDADLQTADIILSSAFQRSESWIRDLGLFRKLQPDGIFLASQDDFPAGMVATIIYSNYAYVGLMGIHQEFQRQGVGLVLMQHVLTFMQQKRVPVVRLDASPCGQPLYEKLGFVPLEEVFVLQQQKRDMDYQRPSGLQILTLQDLDLLTASDHQAFGADRGRLLQALLESYPGRAFTQQNKQGNVGGYLFVQEKRIGPWVMTGHMEAEPLLQAALSLPFPGPASVVVPAENPAAVTLLKRHGFGIVRVNRHMAYGSDLPAGQRQRVFAQASLSLG